MQSQLPSPSLTTLDKSRYIEEFDRIRGIIRRGWRYIALAIVICLTLGALHLARTRTIYLSSARLLVLQQGGRPLSVPNANGDGVFKTLQTSTDSIETQVTLIRSPVIIERAIKELGMAPSQVDNVLAGLTVKLPEQQVRVLEIGYRSTDREQALKVTRAIIKSYEQFLKDNYQKSSDQVIGLIVKARDELSEELRKLEREYLEFRQKNPAYTSDETGRPFVSRRLDHWDQTANQVMVRALQLQSQLELGRKLVDQGAGDETLMQALNQLGSAGSEAVGVLAPTERKQSVGTSIERLETELAEVVFQRESAERLLAHLQPTQRSDEERRQREQEIGELFNRDPAVVEIRSELRRAEARLAQAERLSRKPGDVSVTAARRRLEKLTTELDNLWEEKRPLLLSEYAKSDESASNAAESELVMLRAKEAALREHLQETKAERIRQLLTTRDALTRALGPNDAKVRAVQEQIARLENNASQNDDTATQPSRSETVLNAIEHTLTSIESMRSKIKEKFEADLAEAKKAETNMLAEANLRSDLERHRSLFNSVVDQLKQAQLISDFGTVTSQTIHPPSVREVKPSVVLILVAALAVGTALGGGAAFVADLMDVRIRSISEIRRVLDLHVLGMIPHLAPAEQESIGEVGLISHLMPHSRLSEAYKSVRTNIEFLRRNQDAQVLMITSPQSGDGKSTTASNVAISLAHAGRRVLLVDADIRKPTQHAIHGLRRDYGLVHILRGKLPLHRTVQRTQVENLDLLPSGPDVPNPAELLASPRLADFIQVARDAYDVVIIDTSPLLAITDPAIVGASVDRIILVARASVTRLHDAERAVEILRSLGTPVLGAIVNGITQEMHTYGYGYGYGYGHRYGVYGSDKRDRAIDRDDADSLEPSSTGAGELPSNGQIAPPIESGI